jgi:hypothetical protein
MRKLMRVGVAQGPCSFAQLQTGTCTLLLQLPDGGVGREPEHPRAALLGDPPGTDRHPGPVGGDLKRDQFLKGGGDT